MKRLAVLLLAAATLEARPIAFTNVNVVPMTSDAVLRKQAVVVDEGRIVAVGPETAVAIPAGADRIDGEGATIVPGLIDLHVHLTQPDDLTLYAANGVTTILNLSGDLDVLEWSRHPRALGPRIITTGRAILHVKDAAAATRIVSEAATDGYRGIKIYDDISVEALKVFVDEARRNNLLSIGHIPRNLRWQDMLAAKPDAIAHAEEFLYSPVEKGDRERIVAGMRDGGISLITTLVAYDTIGRQIGNEHSMAMRGEMAYINPAIRRMWSRPFNNYLRDFKTSRVPDLRWRLAFQKTLIKQLHDGGVPILLGTDAGGPAFVFAGFTAIDELRELVSAGLTPYEALRAGTVDAAKFLRADTGTIEVGKSADFVLVRGNPLTDIENMTIRAGVCVRGEWFDSAALHTALERVAAMNEAEQFVLDAVPRGADAVIRAGNAVDVRESTLNELGYQFMFVDGKPAEAVKVFRANVDRHPQSSAAWDSLGVGLERAGLKTEAEEARKKSVALRH